MFVHMESRPVLVKYQRPESLPPEVLFPMHSPYDQKLQGATFHLAGNEPAH